MSYIVGLGPMCTHSAIMCDYELLLKTQVALDLTMFIHGHSAVSIRFCTTPLHVKVLAGTVLCQ